MKRFNLITKLLSLVIIYFFISPQTIKCQIESDTTRHALLEKLIDKNTSKLVQVTLSIRPVFHTNLRSSDDDTDGTFRFDYLMLTINGYISDKLSYQYTQHLHEGSTALEADNLSTSINYAYLQYDFSPKLSFIAGKQSVLFGGFEYNEAPIDVMTYSMTNNYLNCYLTGITLSYYLTEEQELAFQAVNNRTENMSDTYGVLPENIKRSKLPLIYSIGWNSTYFDNKLQLRYAISASEQAKGKWAFIASGGQFIDFGKVNFYIDFLYQRSALDQLGALREIFINSDGIQGETAVHHTEYFTSVAKLNYQIHPRWNIHLKSFYDIASIYKNSSYQSKGKYLSAWCYEGGIEFFPLKNKDAYCFLNVANHIYKRHSDSLIVRPDNTTQFLLGFVYNIPVI